MRKGGFLEADELRVLAELARDGLAEHRLARRANALIRLDRGMSYSEVAKVLLLDDETVRGWRQVFEADGVDGLAGFHYGGRKAFLTADQEAELKAWVTQTLPRTTREVGAWIEAKFGISYASRSGLIELLHRLGFEHRRPKAVSSKMDPEKQRRFIAEYEALLNSLLDDELVMFSDAVHPVHGAQPVGCWAPADVAVAVEQTTGREHLNIQGAINLETGETEMLPVDQVDAVSTIALLAAIEARYPTRRKIHIFLDNANLPLLKTEWVRVDPLGARVCLLGSSLCSIEETIPPSRPAALPCWCRSGIARGVDAGRTNSLKPPWGSPSRGMSPASPSMRPKGP